MEEVRGGPAGPFEDLEVIGVQAGMSTTRFCQLIDMPERTWRRWQAKTRTGQPAKGPWPRPARQAVATPQRSQQRPGFDGRVMTSGIKTDVPVEKRIEWNEDRIRYWLNTGAQPSKPVARLLDRVSVPFVWSALTAGGAHTAGEA